jgi:hypothetical protein
MLVEYLWYALIGAVVVLAFVGMLVLNIRSERARSAAEAKMTPEQLEAARSERYHRWGNFS